VQTLGIVFEPNRKSAVPDDLFGTPVALTEFGEVAPALNCGYQAFWRNVMKTLFVISFLLATTAAFGQSAAGVTTLDNEAHPLMVQMHPQTASAQPLGVSRNLLGTSGYSSARGERPLWEVVSEKTEVPLGDIARNLRKERYAAKKATWIREN
jgi:hypothetical protein